MIYIFYQRSRPYMGMEGLSSEGLFHPITGLDE